MQTLVDAKFSRRDALLVVAVTCSHEAWPVLAQESP
jgi:hypothetical protein